MKTIGLTGGIGSGKSAVLQVFSKMGIPCYKADSSAKKLMQDDQTLIHQIKTLFGNEIYNNNKLDRAKLADFVFKDKIKLERLNSIVHPVVQKDFRLFLSQQSAPYVVKEAAILFETGGHKACDANILIVASESLRIERVMKRDCTNVEKIKERMNHQWSDEKKIPLADFVINNIDWDKTLKILEDIHQKILNIK